MFRALLLVLAVGMISVIAVELYSDEFDHLDVDMILSDDQHREAYYDCFMDAGPCDSLTGGHYFKANFPEALVTKCARCTEKQKVMVEKIVLWYAANQAEKWNKLIAKLLEDAKKMKLAGA